MGVPTCPLRKGRASKLIGKPILAHLNELSLGILIRTREARNQPYSRILDFEVITIFKTTITTVQEVYVVMGKLKVVQPI